MAMKVAVAAAHLMALVAVASATTYTTTVTTTSMEEQNYQQCSQRMQGKQFQSCQRFLQQRSGPYMNKEADEAEEEDLVNRQQDSSLRACCQELKQMDHQQCGCEDIRRAVRQAQQSGPRFQTGQSEQIYQKTRSLPRRCGLRQQQCRFSLVFV